MNIDIIDLNLLKKGNSFELLRLHHALRDPGFSFLRNHGLNEDAIHDVFTSWQDFVKLPDIIRKDYEKPETGYQIGYTPFGVEKGVGAKIADEKHFWHTRDTDCLYVHQIPGFKKAQNELFLEFDRLYAKLMSFVAQTLKLPGNYFEGALGNSVLRSIHYPASANPLQDDGEVNKGGNLNGLCAYKHTDINMLTLLLARERGLQLLQGEVWREVTIEEPDLIIVNCGDMLEHLTGGFYTSGVHRVVCEPGKERFSFPFFGHPIPSFRLSPLEHLGGKSERYPYETAGEFLEARLRDINLK